MDTPNPSPSSWACPLRCTHPAKPHHAVPHAQNTRRSQGLSDLRHLKATVVELSMHDLKKLLTHCSTADGGRGLRLQGLVGVKKQCSPRCTWCMQQIESTTGAKYIASESVDNNNNVADQQRIVVCQWLYFRLWGTPVNWTSRPHRPVSVRLHAPVALLLGQLNRVLLCGYVRSWTSRKQRPVILFAVIEVLLRRGIDHVKSLRRSVAGWW